MENIIKRDYPYTISTHEIEGNCIVFYHYVPKFQKNTTTNLFEFVGKVEEEWFKLVKTDKLNLMSNSRFFESGDYPCSDSEVMRYLRGVSGAKLINSKELLNYDEDNYGRCVEIGTYIYETWDISGIK